MRLATIIHNSMRRPCLIDPDRGAIPLDLLLTGFNGDLMAVLSPDVYAQACEAARSVPASAVVDLASVTYAAPYTAPSKLWGIGLNYVDHAGDLSENVPDEPASFMKGNHTIVGPGDPIPLPHQSKRVTAEAELGLVVGRYCRNVSETEALDYVWGVVPILDQTAEDILQRNPRFLTRSKNFPGFFSFGPELVPLQEVLTKFASLAEIEVATVHNGRVHRSNRVANMTYSPEMLMSFHSQVMPLFPGDIISTGTPGAVVIADGDHVESRIAGIGVLGNAVRRADLDGAK